MFATFEGPEGAGKTTLVEGLRERLVALGHDVLVTREPGAGTVGKAIREILLHGETLNPQAESFLFLADRSQHVATIVKPHLRKGGVVLCDRYIDSTVVYQGHARGLDIEELRRGNHLATGGLLPDVTFLLDLDPAVGLQRIRSKDRLDSEPLAFHERVRKGFLEEAARAPKRFVILDASLPASQCLETAWEHLLPMLPQST
jgi:dTMP kinase